MKAKKSQILIVAIIVLIAIVSFIVWNSKTAHIPIEIKNNSYCGIYSNYPNPNCPYGRNITVSLEELCKVGYTKTVRNVTSKIRAEVLKRYNISAGYGRANELDHIVPLCLSGSNDIENLWVEPSNTKDFRLGYQTKDKIENLLHRKVCNGEITLEQAQYDIVYNWTRWIEKA
jgi:hypothetical protein